jgi:hypothetical protein
MTRKLFFKLSIVLLVIGIACQAEVAQELNNVEKKS